MAGLISLLLQVPPQLRTELGGALTLQPVTKESVHLSSKSPVDMAEHLGGLTKLFCEWQVQTPEMTGCGHTDDTEYQCLQSLYSKI